MNLNILGAGNMTTALFCLSNLSSFDSVKIFTPSFSSAENLSKLINNSAPVKHVDELNCSKQSGAITVHFLGFKPQGLNEVVKNYKKMVSSGDIIISILAGIKSQTLVDKFNCQHIVRLMPNTPSKLGKGTTLIYSNQGLQDQFSHNIRLMFEGTGKLFFLEQEKNIDELTPFSGSGPGLFFEIARIFEEKIISLGYSPLLAKEIISQTMIGSGHMLQESIKENISTKTLRKNVTSKGGVTEQALRHLEQNNLQHILNTAVDHALKKNSEFSKAGD